MWESVDQVLLEEPLFLSVLVMVQQQADYRCRLQRNGRHA
jgi:hypothetical protein